MTNDEALMTKEFPNDPMPDASFRLLIRALGFFRHSGLGISHFAERHDLGLGFLFRSCGFHHQPND
jgi:hypothetical protein